MSDAVIIAVIGGVSGIVTTLITGVPKLYELWRSHKGDTVESRIEKAMQDAMKKCSKMTNEKLDNIQKDVTRMRLMSLIQYEPLDAENILKVGKIYFDGMKGNSEASKRFDKWLKQQNIKRPLWFKYEEVENGKK